MSTALVYDPMYLEHDTGNHPENAGRLRSVMRAVEQSGLLETVRLLRPKAATVEEIATVHAMSYIDQVRHLAEGGGGDLDPDTFVSPLSYEAALKAAGGTILAMQQVVEGVVDNALALVRPPGHHAVTAQGMGFCLFNNVAIATKLAQANYGLERILIVDFDIHHGNGTQETFWRDGRVLYFSLHQSPFFPGTGKISEVGADAGRGCIVNVPLPVGVGDEGHLHVFEEVLGPVARQFRPQLIAVSAGYDGHWADPLGGMSLSVNGYARMTDYLKRMADELCEGKLFLVLEGGYDLQALSLSIMATLNTLLGLPVHDPLGPNKPVWAEPDVEPILREVKRIHHLP